MLINIMKSSWKFVIADVFVWLIAHNLPLLIAYSIKDYFQSPSLLLVIGIALLFLIRLLSIKIGAYIDIKAQQKWSELFYLQAYACIQNGTVDVNANHGQLLNSLNEDISVIVSTISYAIDTFCNIIYGGIAICILFSIHTSLTISILCLPIVAITINMFAKKRIANLSEKVKESNNNFSTNLFLLLKNSRILRVNHMEEALYEQIEKDVMYQKKAGLHHALWSGFLNSITNMMTECNILIILFAYMKSDNLSVGAVILFITYAFDLAAMSQYISSLTISVQNMKVYLQNFEDKFHTRLNKHALTFNNEEIFSHIQLGKVNVLIGNNGVGKSRCLQYFLQSESNSVLLPEKYHLFDMSVEENIRLGDKHKDTKYYANLACVDLELDYICNHNISGGQELRIVLARTLCFGKDYILIDNNFTSIDINTRKQIFENLMALHKTVIFTDHIHRDLYEDMHKIYI